MIVGQQRQKFNVYYNNKLNIKEHGDIKISKTPKFSLKFAFALKPNWIKMDKLDQL